LKAAFMVVCNALSGLRCQVIQLWSGLKVVSHLTTMVLDMKRVSICAHCSMIYTVFH